MIYLSEGMTELAKEMSEHLEKEDTDQDEEQEQNQEHETGNTNWNSDRWSVI